MENSVKFADICSSSLNEISNPSVKYKPCIRCGLCCITGLCYAGEYRKDIEICKYFRVEEDLTTACKFMEENVAFKNDMLNKGCFLRSYSMSLYNYYTASVDITNLKKRIRCIDHAQYHNRQTNREL